MEKRGQMKLSFGMIFSIILIIVFLAFAFYAIQKFISFQTEIKYKTFIDDFQVEVDKMWKSSQGSKEVTYILPKKTRAICFEEDPFENLIYKGKDLRDGEMINHLDIEKTLELGNTNTLCVNGFEGKFTFIIQKNYGDSLVTVSKI